MLNRLSTIQKKAAANSTMISTITEVIQVSLRLGHTILRPSARTWLKNWAGERRGLAGAGASTVTVWAPAAAGAAPGFRRPVYDLALAIQRLFAQSILPPQMGCPIRRRRHNVLRTLRCVGTARVVHCSGERP